MLETIFEQVIIKAQKRPFEIECDFKILTDFKKNYDFPELYQVGQVFFSLNNKINNPVFVQGGFAKKYIGVNKEKGLFSIIDIKNKVLLFEQTLFFEKKELNDLMAKLESMDFFKVTMIAKKYGHIILAYFNYALFNGDYDKMAREFNKVNIPPELKKPNDKYLYRGLVLSQGVTDKISKGGIFTLKPREVSSWSFDKGHALGFVTGQGVLLKEEASKMSIIINAGLPDIQRGILKLRGKNEKECIVKGNGIPNKISIHSGNIDSVIYNNVASRINIQIQQANQ